MKMFSYALVVVSAWSMLSARSEQACAQHLDVLVEQINGKLVTGSADFDTGQWTIGRRVFSSEFDNDFAVNSPGYNGLASGSPSLPAGSQALPGNRPLGWDFLPITIAPLKSNLLYWNGLESDNVPGLSPNDVAFGPLLGSSYSLTLFDKSGSGYAVTGSNAIVPGGIIDDTAADGSLHRHRFYVLQDGDGNSATLPADGIYLFSLQMRMNGLISADPMFMVFGTPGSSVAALDSAAVPWVKQHLTVPGDYNGNGSVDAADYVLWRKNDRSQAGYELWRANFGRTANSGNDAPMDIAVPEPATVLFLLLVAMALSICRAR